MVWSPDYPDLTICKDSQDSSSKLMAKTVYSKRVKSTEIVHGVKPRRRQTQAFKNLLSWVHTGHA